MYHALLASDDVTLSQLRTCQVAEGKVHNLDVISSWLAHGAYNLLSAPSSQVKVDEPHSIEIFCRVSSCAFSVKW